MTDVIDQYNQPEAKKHREEMSRANEVTIQNELPQDFVVITGGRMRSHADMQKHQEERKSKRLANACYKLFEKLGAGSPTLATIGSWKDTIDDEEVLQTLEDMSTWKRDDL